MNRLKTFVQVLLWIFPWSLRRFVYVHAFGFKLGEGSRIGYSIVLAKEVRIGKNSAIRNFTFVRAIDRLVLGDYSYIVNLNWITGTSTSDIHHFTDVKGRRCELILGNHSALTSRHFVDCTGGVRIGDFTTVGGAQSQFLTHYIDPYECRQTCKSIEIGNYCFVGTHVLMLPGAGLPDYSILGGGGVLTKKFLESRMLYVGNPAQPKKNLGGIAVKYFERVRGVVD